MQWLAHLLPIYGDSRGSRVQSPPDAYFFLPIAADAIALAEVLFLYTKNAEHANEELRTQYTVALNQIFSKQLLTRVHGMSAQVSSCQAACECGLFGMCLATEHSRHGCGASLSTRLTANV